MKNIFRNQKARYALLGILAVALICIGVTYAYWLLTKEQTGKNVVKSACLKIDFSGENDIQLDDAYPMDEEQLENFLTNQTPYNFTITNKCNNLQNAVINLETLNVSNTLLEDDYIDVLLYENDYHEKLNKANKLTGNTLNDSNKVIKEARHAYALYNFTLKNNETREFNLQIYLDKDTPMNENTMNASWKGKITLSTEYTNDKFINAGTLRTISSSDSNGMWKYKSNIKQIVIEDSKNRKTSDDKVVYGPFDESTKQDNSIQSYVVCEIGDTNCIGYLQGNGGVKANPDSSNLFNGYTKVTDIIGMENLDTSEVTNMNYMFVTSNVKNLDLSSFDTRKVTNMSGIFGGATFSTLNISNWDLSSLSPSSSAGMFGGNTNLTTIDMTNFVFPTNSGSFFAASLTNLENIILNGANTSNVTNMSSLFYGLSSLKSLDLSSFDTSSVTNMSYMFNGCSKLTSLDLSNFNTEKLENVNGMFTGMKSLQELNLSNWIFNDQLSKTFVYKTNIYDYSEFNNLILENVNTSNVTNMESMFMDLPVKSLDLSSFDTSNVTNMRNMFGNMNNLQSLNISSFDTTNVIDMSAMFRLDNNLTEIDYGNNFVHNSSVIITDMFSGTEAPRPPHSSWQGVSFD